VSKKRILLNAFAMLALGCSYTMGAYAQDAAKPDEAAVQAKIAALEKQLDDLKASVATLKAAPAPAPAAAPAAAPATLSSILGPTTISGFVDVYAGADFTRPANRTAQLRAFDANMNSFNLGEVELIIDRAPDAAASRLGYHIAFGYGQATDAVNASTVGSSSTGAYGQGGDKFLKEAYFSYLAKVGKGLQFDVGKFVTPAGAEVIEAKDNFNYSRGLLFSYAVPFDHYGVRAKYTYSPKASLTYFLVNGWNNSFDNNARPTGGLSLALTPNAKWSIIQNWLIGPEDNAASRIRNLLDTVVTYNATKKLTLMGNFDYGKDAQGDSAAPSVWWSGVAAYAKYAFNDKWAVAGRYEFYDDHNGFTTGLAQHLNGGTFTLEHTVLSHLIGRLEYRNDTSAEKFFVKHDGSLTNHQDTVTLGLIYTFDSKGDAK